MIPESFFSWSFAGRLTAACALLFSFEASRLQATQLELIYNGVFNAQDALNPVAQGIPSYFAGATPFTVTAYFDTSGQNYAPAAGGPFNGFRAYSPSQVSISIAGMVYSIDTIAANPSAGLSIAIFDQNSFTPGHYAIGILQNPPADGAGFIGDFTSASTDFTASNIVPTTFTNYQGVGYGSGICLQGTGANCQMNQITPFILHSGGNTFALTLGNYDEDYPASLGAPDLTGPLNSAQLIATPEPSTVAFLAIGLAGFYGASKLRRAFCPRIIGQLVFSGASPSAGWAASVTTGWQQRA